MNILDIIGIICCVLIMLLIIISALSENSVASIINIVVIIIFIIVVSNSMTPQQEQDKTACEDRHMIYSETINDPKLNIDKIICYSKDNETYYLLKRSYMQVGEYLGK